MSGSINMSNKHLYKHCGRYQCLYHRLSTLLVVPMHSSYVNASKWVNFLAQFGIKACISSLLLCQICQFHFKLAFLQLWLFQSAIASSICWALERARRQKANCSEQSVGSLCLLPPCVLLDLSIVHTVTLCLNKMRITQVTQGPYLL